jgi:hypothetical protein
MTTYTFHIPVTLVVTITARHAEDATEEACNIVSLVKLDDNAITILNQDSPLNVSLVDVSPHDES